jgi:CRP-like cAMP-binding protein
MRLRSTTAASCVHCPLGRAAGVGRGGRCPFEPRRYRAGELVCSAGSPAETVWYVKRGLVALSRGGASGEDVGHHVVPAGGLVGLDALGMRVHSDTARAVGSATLCAAPRGALDAWLGPPGAPSRVVLELVIETRLAASPRAAGVDASAMTRVARWLGEAASGEVVPAIERRFLASVLGMTPETLSRIVSRLEALGAIERVARTIRIRDAGILGRFARGEPGPRPIAHGPS